MLRMRSFNIDEITALSHNALAEILADPYHQQRFLDLTGVTPQQIRHDLHKPEFLAAILDYLMQDEAFLKDFAETQDLNPAAITLARLRLPGTPYAH